MKHRFLYFLFFSFVTTYTSYAQLTAATCKQRAALIYKNIQHSFLESQTGLFFETNNTAKNPEKHSYLWPLCALVQAANEMEAVTNTQQYLPVAMNAIKQYYSNDAPAPGYQSYVTAEKKADRFYDDNQWIAIAYMDAYNRTKQKNYLTLSEEIYRFFMTGYDTASGGGLYWKEKDSTTKNTCSNGPGILVCLQLYKATHQKEYLDNALKLYHWTNKYLQTPEGLYYDALKIPSLLIDSALYTYNTGTMLQSNVLLYQLTGDQTFLKEAERIAIAAKAHFFKNDHLSGNYWFDAVLARGLIALYEQDHQQEWINMIQSDVEYTWNTQRDAQNLLGEKGTKTLIDQAAMMEIYARLAMLLK